MAANSLKQIAADLGAGRFVSHDLQHSSRDARTPFSVEKFASRLGDESVRDIATKPNSP